MNLDKSISDLTKKLDELYPTASIDLSDKNDGINFWKGKQIISVKEWNEIYDKHSIRTAENEITIVSRKPFQYFPDVYNRNIYILRVNPAIKDEVEKWNYEYYELLEFRKNPDLGRRKCSGCLLATHLDDPIFVGIERIFARIIKSHSNNYDSSDELITYPCSVMNIYNCPFDIDNNKYPYTKEELFLLQRIAFILEQTIGMAIETTKNNDIIYQVDFERNRIQEIHTDYKGEPEPWGWYEYKNLEEQLSKVKPILDIEIRDEYDICNYLTDIAKLESLFKQYLQSNKHKEGQQCQIMLCCATHYS